MSSTNNPELRLKLMESIASTVMHFMEQDGASESGVREDRIAAEDLAEYIVNSLGMKIMDELSEDGSITVSISKITPEEFRIENVI